jgi:hypothetical protein
MFWKNFLLINLAIVFVLIFGILPGTLATSESLGWLLMYSVWPFAFAAIITIDEKKEGNNMEKKIINLIKETEGGTCLLCCEREATVKVAINRVKYDDNVVGFHVCDKCLSQMHGDIQKICE